MVIRRARSEDLPLLRDLEVRAGEPFREIGMDEIADDEPAPVADGATAWLAPYYARIGFRVIDELGPQLAALVDHERQVIPGDAPRVAMARPV